MAPKWSSRTRVDLCRHADDFPRYPDPLSDADGWLTRWLDAVQIHPLGANEWKCLDNWRVGPRTLDDSFWFCFPKGRGKAWIDEGRHSFRFGPGDLILIPKGTPHFIRLDRGPRTNLLVVHFHPSLFGNINFLDLLGFPFHVPFSPDAPFERASAGLVRDFAVRAPGWSRTTANAIFDTLVYIIRHHGKRFQGPGNKTSYKELIRLQPALDLIEKRFADVDLTVTDMARGVSLSEVRFRKLLHQLTGLGPVVFLQRHRIQHACTLLRTTNLNIKQIAKQSGFADLSFFYRVFKHLTNKTPTVYREIREV